MAYTKQVWKYSGESGAIPLSPEKLNHMEDGIYAAALRAVGATTGNICILDANGNPIDSLKKPADFALKVAGAVNGHFAGLDANGYLTDSGKKATDFEPMNIVRHTVYKPDGGSAWYKILSFPVAESAVKIEGYSVAGYYAERGHWELVICKTGDAESIRADLIYGTNGITAESFDVRVNDDIVNVYFYLPQYTYYRFLSECIYPTTSITLTTGNAAETPTGTAVTVNPIDILALLYNKRPSFDAVEFVGGVDFGGYIDFHYGGSTDDYTSRVVELSPGVLSFLCGINLGTPLALGSGGTGATTAAGARTNLGILTYTGSVSVPSGQNYVNVTISGLTSSHRALAMRTGETQTTTGVIPKSTVCSTNNCRVYFSDNGSPTSVGLYIIATL